MSYQSIDLRVKPADVIDKVARFAELGFPTPTADEAVRAARGERLYEVIPGEGALGLYVAPGSYEAAEAWASNGRSPSEINIIRRLSIRK